MQVQVLKSKLYRARVTAASVNYEGSLTIDEDLMDEVGFLPYEKILIANVSNGNRFETYILKGKRGSGAIELNGATAKLGKKGDILIIFSFTWDEEKNLINYKPRTVTLDRNNKVIK